MGKTEQLLIALAISLCITLTAELLLAFLVGARKKKCIISVLLVNILTNPAVVLLYYMNSWYFGLPVILFTVILELCAFLTEAVCYVKLDSGFKHPVIFSAMANIFSYCIGYLISIW